MDIADVRDARNRQSFRPFEIRLADGRSLPVSRPDCVALGRRRIVVIGKNDTTSMVAPLLIVSIETTPKLRGGKR
jgi:hypothetical protein